MASSSYGFGAGTYGMPATAAAFLSRAYDTGAISPTAVAGNSESVQTFTVTGLQTQDILIVRKPTVQTNLLVAEGWVSATNTLSIRFVNLSAQSITPTASETYRILATRVSAT